MKILQINKFFYLKGGAERYLLNLRQLLENKGHQIIFFSMQSNENLPSDYHKYFVSHLDFSKVNLSFSGLKIIVRMIYSLEAKKKIEELIKKTRPEIAHIHNIYHQISPSILPVLKKYKIPTVMTLHDWKLICPNYKLLDNSNRICEKCKRYKYYHCFLDKCVKNSYLASGLVCLETYIHKILKIYEKNIDLFIAPSQFMKDKCVEFGIDFQKIAVLPNFVEKKSGVSVQEPKFGAQNSRDYILYFGRLSPEKGVDVLLRAMRHLKSRVKLKITGDGPKLKNYQQQAISHRLSVDFLGYLQGEKLEEAVRKAAFIVVPSLCYENCPLSILEAFAREKPVIASKIGGIPELIEDRKTGLLFRTGDEKDLAEKIEWLIKRPEQTVKMGEEAKKVAEERFAAEKHYEEIIKIYKSLINELRN